MVRREDERAVTVQIGAVLLLAIVFAALVLYQLNAVPAENEQVEYTHNQEVRNEMQDLRNAIQNVGTAGGTQSTSVTLGTQYPSRTIAVNPPAARGTLETTEMQSIQIEKAAVSDESEYERDGDSVEATTLTDELITAHNTTTIAYEPGYNEYRTAPTTRIEHGLAFNDFDDAQVSLTDQPLVSNDTIRIVTLEGDLSESGTSAVSLDPTALSGLSDEIPIERASEDENITVSIPTTAPAVWNDTVGTTFNDGEAGARVIAYDGPDDGSGSLTIELAGAAYDLQLSRVSLDGSGGATDEYEISKAEATDNHSGQPSAYETNWSGNQRTEYFGNETASLTMKAMDEGEPVQHGSVSYAIRDEDNVINKFENSGTTNESGQNTTMLDFNNAAVSDSGSKVTVYVSSGGSSNQITLHIERSNGGSEPETSEIAWSITDDTSNNEAQYAVSYEMTASSFEHVRVEFDNQDSGTPDVYEPFDSRGTVEHSEGGAGGDTYSITITAFDGNGTEIDTKTTTDTADGMNPDGNDDLGAPDDPQLDTSRVDDWSQPNDNTARYFVSYDITNRDEFDRVKVSFKNRDRDTITTETSTDPRGRLEFSGNRIDNEFEIELHVYDTDGVLVDTRTFDDTADGVNPIGNDDLSTDTTPQFEAVSVTDTGDSGQSAYTAEYDVSNSGALGTVWAEFRNLDSPWATEIIDQPDASGEFVHEPGGGTGGDAYEITLLVFDSNGAVVDRWYDDRPG